MSSKLWQRQYSWPKPFTLARMIQRIKMVMFLLSFFNLHVILPPVNPFVKNNNFSGSCHMLNGQKYILLFVTCNYNLNYLMKCTCMLQVKFILRLNQYSILVKCVPITLLAICILVLVVMVSLVLELTRVRVILPR